MTFWKVYVLINTAIILFYVWYRTILLFITESFEKRYPLYNKPFSVIIPVYNEKSDILYKCINSIYKSLGEKEIIIVDDGSTEKDTLKLLNKIKKKSETSQKLYSSIKVIFSGKNQGKREAHKIGFLEAKYDIICVTDSDTVVERDSFQNLLRPFNDYLVGATTGDIRALNENENIITKIQGAKYWTGLNIDRRSQSFWGIVTCCSGALAAYRKNLVIDYLEEYTNQIFLGNKCNSGDDRYLTNLILRNWRVKYVKEAIAYTEVPKTFKKWTKQQLRWKRSYIRESLICLKNSWGKKRLLFFETIFNLIFPIITLGVRIAFIYYIIIYPILIFYLLPITLFVTVIRNSPLLFEKPKKMIYAFLYVIYYNFVFYWLYFVALFTFNNTDWGTR